MCVLLIYLSAGTVFGQSTVLRGYRQLELGLSMERVQELLTADPGFQYRGPADLSMALSRDEPVIDTRGRGFITRGLFQFHLDRLYILTLYLDDRQLDYFQLFQQMSRRYGDPVDLDPRRALWEDERTRIELERPLVIRYIDLDEFETRRRERQTLQAAREVSRETFLEDF